MGTTAQTNTATMTGKVKFFDAGKGFGFIQPDTNDVDVFVHVSELDRSGLPNLLPDQRVGFETRPDKKGKGLRAFNLKLLD